MAWQLLRNDQLVLDLCPELKDASFETLGAEMAELGLTLRSASTSPPSWHKIIDAKKRRRPARTALRAGPRPLYDAM